MALPGVIVPDLKMKLDALVRFTPIGSRTSLGAHFLVGKKRDRPISEGGIRDWETAKPGKKAANQIPSEHYQTLLKVIGTYLPGNRTDAELRDLLHGPLNAFCAALLSGSDGNWTAFLRAESEHGRLSLHKSEIHGDYSRLFGPLERVRPEPVDLMPMTPGETYRIGFETQFRRTRPFRVFVLQCQEGQWDMLELDAEDRTLSETTGRQVIVPMDGQNPGLFRVKETARGILQFVAVAVQADLPEALRQTLIQGGAITGQQLDGLAYALSNIDARDRRIVTARCYVPRNWATTP